MQATPHVEPTIDPGAPMIVGFTSGTTSGAKGAVVSTRGFLAVPIRHHRATPYTFRDRGDMPAPVSHITGLLMAVTLPLVSGCSVVLRERWDAARAVDDMRDYGVTYTGGATVFIQELADAVEAAGLDRAPAHVRLQPRRERDSRSTWSSGPRPSGSGPAPAYGMTECPTVSASLGDDGPDVRCVTDGRILPGVEVRVVDADGHDVGAAARASSSSGGRSVCSATSTRSTPATASTPTAGSAAATSASSTTATASRSPAAPRTSSTAAARSCRRRRSRGCCAGTPTSATWPWSPPRTRGWARSPPRS